MGVSKGVQRIRQRKARYVRQHVHLPADSSRLYGPLPEAAAYLLEVHAQHPQARLYEHWTGYEDMEMVFLYSRPETPQEYLQRLRAEHFKRQLAEQQRKHEAERAKDLQDFQRLARKLGRVV